MVHALSTLHPPVKTLVLQPLYKVDKFWVVFQPSFAKNLAPYRIGKLPHKQNRAKIHQKNRKLYFGGIFDAFLGYLRAAVFSYPVGGQVFPKPSSPNAH